MADPPPESVEHDVLDGHRHNHRSLVRNQLTTAF